jgi:WD40 repeat protein
MRDSSVDLFRIDDAKRVGRLRGSGSPVLDISFDRQKGLLAAVELGKGVHLWWKRDVEVSVASGRLRKADRARPKKKRAARAKVPPQLLRRRVVVIRTDFDISRTAVDRRGRFVAATAWPERLALWDSRNGKKLWDRRKPPGHVSFRRMPPGGRRRPVMVTFNPKSSRAFVFGRSNRIYRWNPRSGKNVRYLVNPKGTLEAILFAHDGLSYFALLSNGKVRHYHISGRLQKTFETLQNPFWMAVCPTGDLFATAQGWDELAVHSAASGKKLWQRKSGRLKRYVIKAMKFDSGCNRLLTYHGTGFVRVHDARSGDLIERSLLGFPDEASECAFHPGLRWVACGWARRVQLRSTASGELLVDLRVPVGFPGMVESLYFNMKGDTLLARVGKRAVVVWRFDEGKLAEHGEEKSERPRPPAGARPGERPDIAPGRPEPRVPRIYFPRSRPRRRNKPSLKQGGFDAEDDSKSGSDGEKKRPNEKKK